MADIVLRILKSNDKFNNPIDKRVEIEKVLDQITDQVFQQMLDIAQSITDFTTTTHPYIYKFHNDQPIKTMQNIVAYNLLIRVFEDGPWSRPQPQILYMSRKVSYEMLLILNNESVKPIYDTQQEMIDNLLKGLSGHIFYELLVVIISKFFPDFVHRWDNVAFSVKPAKSCFGSWWSIASLRTWDDDEESVENEEESGGFKESENLLGSHAMASAPRDLPDHHRSLFLSRKGGGDRSVVEEKSSHDKGSQAHRRR
ncbi:hypothetical protein Scep_008915 [Stephania cephalantha]|uniref:Uncharacterized protein n=1 Tax=Stephania cephalantha TaxID=152367 RepID=A0AAP0JSW6_9MAGN